MNGNLSHHDAIIIGAGIAGMYQLLRLRELGLQVQVFETGDNVGGTWYWNRYPGARFDSESYSYGYSFSPELLDEWEWSEHFAAQPETLRYLNTVADKFDLRKDIRFNARVTEAVFNEPEARWEIATEDGKRASAPFLITAVGPLSAPTLPNVEGIDDFGGFSCHTARWPKEPVEFGGKRVGVIGTGASGVQTIQEVAKTAAKLYVFQRTPNWCAPLNNSKITTEEQRNIKASYPEIFRKCRQTNGCFLHQSDPRNTFEVSPEERLAHYESLYAAPGFGIWVGSFADTLIDEAANAEMSAFVADKIRSRVKDPKVAEQLIPTNHGFGTRRVPLETNYYEVYNQDNVHLVDLRQTPLECVTATGIQTSTTHYPLDMIVYATGFDAVTGALDRIDIRGRGGVKLADKWADRVSTYLGIQTRGFPNLFTLVGPQNTATLCNIPRCIEQNVDWVTAAVDHLRQHGHRQMEPRAESEEEWTCTAEAMMQMSLFMKVNSWISGVNLNVPGKEQPRCVVYPGGAPAYRTQCDAEAAGGYTGFSLS
ncbi:MAG: NAD(P)/FAD-dependent oxidoreductase [Pseudomonadota bacterium]|nr:NAD(P)/FAD-dependent oxidoreductase [Pseudomonadota bacterium]